jgi:hypothetical protein
MALAVGYDKNLMDEDLRLLVALKKMNPNFHLTDTVKKSLRNNYMKFFNTNQAGAILNSSNTDLIASDTYKEDFFQKSNEKIKQEQHLNEQSNKEREDNLLQAFKRETDQLKEELCQLKEEKKSLKTEGQVAAFLRWNIQFDTGNSN